MSIILIIHIVFMIISLIASISMALAALLSLNVPRSVLRISLAVTSIGALCGATLLAVNPVDAKCAMLVSYIIIFSAIYFYTSKQTQLASASGS